MNEAVTQSTYGKLILHVGMPKAGSTSIQHVLHYNRDTLLSYGVLYPLWNIQNCKHVVRSLSCIDAENDTELQSLATELEQTCPQVTFISDENFYHMERQELEAFKNRIASLFEEIEILLFVREPMTFLTSLVHTHILNGVTSFADLNEPYFEQHIDPKNIHKFLDIFGIDKVHIKLFEPDKGQPYNLFEDLMDVIGCVRSDQLTITERSYNVSVSRDIIDMVSFVSEGLSPEVRLGEAFARFSRILQGSNIGSRKMALPQDAWDMAQPHAQAFSDQIEKISGQRFSGFPTQPTSQPSQTENTAALNAAASCIYELAEKVTHYEAQNANIVSTILDHIQYIECTRVHICGAGNYLPVLLEAFRALKIEIGNIIDRSEKLQGTDVFGHRVLSYEDGVTMGGQVYIVASKYFEREIRDHICCLLKDQNIEGSIISGSGLFHVSQT